MDIELIDYHRGLIMTILTIAAILIGILFVAALIVFSKMALGAPKPTSRRVAQLQKNSRRS